MPDRDKLAPIDINALPDKTETNQNEDLDDIDFQNYKGIYANDDQGQKYQCPETGAHFEPRDLCRRLTKVLDKRKALDEQIYGKVQASQVPVVQQEIFSSSIMSEKLDSHTSHNFIPHNQNNINFKNKFEENQQLYGASGQQPPNQLRPQEKPLASGTSNTRAQNKENSYSFVQQKSQKDLTASTNATAQQTISQQIQQQSYNKQRSSQDSRSRGNGSLNTQETYNKLLQLMNERTLKANEKISSSGTRTKSGEKSNRTSNTMINQTTSSTQKLQNHSISHCKVNITQGSQSREKSLGNGGLGHPTVFQQVLKSQNKALSGNSRNAQNGIGGPQNTQQNATKQFMSLYNNINSILAQKQQQTISDQQQQQVYIPPEHHILSAQIIENEPVNSQKLQQQKSLGALANEQERFRQKMSNVGSIDNQQQINEMMSRYLKNGNQGVSNQGTIVQQEKSRNSQVFSSKTQTESMSKGSSQQKNQSRPITSSHNYPPHQQPHQVNNVLQPKVLQQTISSTQKRKSGSGYQIPPTRNNQLGYSQTTQGHQQQYDQNMTEYLKRLEQSSQGPQITTAALNELQKKIEAKMGKSRGSGIQPSSNSFLGINNAQAIASGGQGRNQSGNGTFIGIKENHGATTGGLYKQQSTNYYSGGRPQQHQY